MTNEFGQFLYVISGVAIKITGETSRSVILGKEGWEQVKVNKAALRQYGHDGSHLPTYWLRNEDALKAGFLRKHRHQVGAAVSRLEDAEVLQRVVALIGYGVKQ